MNLRGVIVGALIFVWSGTAAAALTSSEKGQIKDFVAGARAENAQKVRALVARTDLTPDESTAALVDAVAPVPFTEPRGVFLKELVFGGASGASRPVLVPATVKALLARADVVAQKYLGGLDHEPKAVEELAAIYGWLDGAIANSGNGGIPAATFEECSKIVREHLDRNSRWLKGDGAVPESVSRLRAQAQLMVIDMLPEGLTRRIDAADRLGLHGARKTLLTETGVLFADSGKTEDAKVDRVRQFLVRMPAAKDTLGVIYAGEDRSGPLSARGGVAFAATSDKYPFDDAAPASFDPMTSAIAHDLAIVAAKRALDTKSDLRQQAERDATAAMGDGGSRFLGRPRAPSVEHVIGAAIHALITDGPHAIDLAFARLLGGRAESAALLSDALGAMTVGSERVELGKGTAWVPVSNVKIAPNGSALGFTFEGHTWTIDRASPSYAVMGARRDGAPVSPAQLNVKGIPHDGTTWMQSGYTFTELRGTPRVALAPGLDVKFLASPAEELDAISVVPPSADFVIEAILSVKDAPGGIVIRSSATKKGVRGGALLVTPGGKTTLAVVDDGGETNLAAPIDSEPGNVPVKITVKGTKVEAVVGKATLMGTLPASLAKGDIAIVGKRSATLDLTQFAIKKQ